MTTGGDERTVLLKQDIEREIRRVNVKLLSSKAQAVLLRVSTVAASAAATALLGLKVSGSAGEAITNVVLVLTASSTVAAAYEAFFNPRAEWIMLMEHVQRLQALGRRLADQSARAEGNPMAREIDLLRAEFEGLMRAYLDTWKSLREQYQPDQSGPQSRTEVSSQGESAG
jgi:hypothetical protein